MSEAMSQLTMTPPSSSSSRRRRRKRKPRNRQFNEIQMPCKSIPRKREGGRELKGDGGGRGKK